MFLGFALLALQLGRVRDLSIADGKRLIAGPGRGCPGRSRRSSSREDRAGRGRAAARRGREPVLHRPRARLPGGPRGRAEVQGDLLPARRGLPDLRAQARPARADLPEVPTVAIVPDDELTDRNVGALHEIAARRGPLVVVTHDGRRPRRGRRAPDRRTPQRARARPDPAHHPAAAAGLPRGAAPRATTSTSRATWPSRSRSSEAGRLPARDAASPRRGIGPWLDARPLPLYG